MRKIWRQSCNCRTMQRRHFIMFRGTLYLLKSKHNSLQLNQNRKVYERDIKSCHWTLRVLPISHVFVPCVCHQNGFAPLYFKRIIMKQRLVWTFITFLETPVFWAGGGTGLEVWGTGWAKGQRWCISPGLQHDVPSLETAGKANPLLKSTCKNRAFSPSQTAHPNQIV